ncbi:hypothetical protein BH20ACT2_BH20ACT2_15780 [soil metagenome]
MSERRGRTDERAPGGAPFWIGLVLGLAVLGYGVAGLLDHVRGDALVGWVGLLVGADLVHDLVVAPVACGVGLVVARLGLGRWRGPVQAGLFATAVVLAVAWIPLRDLGGNPDNPTIRPLDYRTATLTVLAAVWVAVTAVGLVCIWMHRRADPAGPGAVAAGEGAKKRAKRIAR